MIYVITKTKPRLAGRGFAHSTSRLFAVPFYPIRTASANAGLSFLPIAVDGTRFGSALFWGAKP